MTSSPTTLPHSAKALLVVKIIEPRSCRAFISWKNKRPPSSEIGYLPLATAVGHLFYQLVAARYEEGACCSPRIDRSLSRIESSTSR